MKLTINPLLSLATFSRYFIEPALLKTLQAELAEPMNRCIVSVQTVEERGV